MAPFDFMAIMRRPLDPGILLPGMVRRPGHEVGTRWLYQSTQMRNLGPNLGFEEYDVVEGCVVERVSYSRNLPEVPVHLVTLDSGHLANANLVMLIAYAAPAYAEGDVRAFDSDVSEAGEPSAEEPLLPAARTEAA